MTHPGREGKSLTSGEKGNHSPRERRVRTGSVYLDPPLPCCNIAVGCASTIPWTVACTTDSVLLCPSTVNGNIPR